MGHKSKKVYVNPSLLGSLRQTVARVSDATSSRLGGGTGSDHSSSWQTPHQDTREARPLLGLPLEISDAGDRDHFAIRGRDRTDAAGKRGFRVEVPKKMLLYTILVFVVLPLVAFFYLLISQLVGATDSSRYSHVDHQTHHNMDQHHNQHQHPTSHPGNDDSRIGAPKSSAADLPISEASGAGANTDGEGARDESKQEVDPGHAGAESLDEGRGKDTGNVAVNAPVLNRGGDDAFELNKVNEEVEVEPRESLAGGEAPRKEPGAVSKQEGNTGSGTPGNSTATKSSAHEAERGNKSQVQNGANPEEVNDLKTGDRVKEGSERRSNGEEDVAADESLVEKGKSNEQGSKGEQRVLLAVEMAHTNTAQDYKSPASTLRDKQLLQQ